MENYEIMDEGIEMVEDVVVDNGSGIGVGIGKTVLIGTILAIAVVAGVKLGKQMVAKIKSKKEAHCPDKEITVEDEDIEYVTSK